MIIKYLTQALELNIHISLKNLIFDTKKFKMTFLAQISTEHGGIKPWQ